ncbi:hypothetical protein KI387_034175, partial [Taxus chinensis]
LQGQKSKLISENQWPQREYCATAATGRAKEPLVLILVFCLHATSRDQLLQNLAAVVEER